MCPSASSRLDALRTEVLARVMPGLRHKMLGKLQPITLLSQILNKKLDNGLADQAYIQTQIQEIKLNARLLTLATQNLFSWLSPDDTLHIPADVLVAECEDLLKMESYTHQLIISNHVTEKEMLPAMEARIMICAVIILLVDKEGENKVLEITTEGSQIRFQWNQACGGSASRNTGLLRNWDWTQAISPHSEWIAVDNGMLLRFKGA